MRFTKNEFNLEAKTTIGVEVRGSHRGVCAAIADGWPPCTCTQWAASERIGNSTLSVYCTLLVAENGTPHRPPCTAVRNKDDRDRRGPH